MASFFHKEKDVQISSADVTPDADIIKVIILASIIITFSVVLIGSIAYIITKNQVVDKLKNQDLINIAESISYKIDSRIERAKEVSLLLAQDEQIKEWVISGEKDELQKNYALTKIKSLATDFDYTNSFVVSAVTNHYWDENGHIIDTMSENDPDDDWFYSTLSSQESVSIQFDYNQERRDTFVFIDALMGDVDSPIAVIGVGLGLNDLSEEFQSFKYGENSNLWLVDNQGKIYLSDNIEHDGKNIELYIPLEIKQKIIENISNGNKEQYNIEYENSEHELTDLIIYPLSSTADWHLLFQIPRSESTNFLNTIKLNTLMASLIILISITFLFYFVSNKLVNPYKKAIKLNRELENKVLERTKELHEKNKKLTDSIEYAQRIQKSILPTEEALKEVFDDYFLIWQPKDTVGGDFYWSKKVDQGFYVAVGDCTGHGVPGALMSMLVISILNQIVNNEKDKPSLILMKLNSLIKQILKQKDRDSSLTDDGLDIGFCYFDEKNSLIFAGAKIALYIKNDRNLRIVKGNRKSVGYTRTSEDYSYTDTVIKIISKDELFYMTTDGYTDQNGGPKNYSFGKKKFVDLINNYYKEPLSKQREIFWQAVMDYMGDEMQRDDITLMAFKLPKG